MVQSVSNYKGASTSLSGSMTPERQEGSRSSDDGVMGWRNPSGRSSLTTFESTKCSIAGVSEPRVRDYRVSSDCQRPSERKREGILAPSDLGYPTGGSRDSTHEPAQSLPVPRSSLRKGYPRHGDASLWIASSEATLGWNELMRIGVKGAETATTRKSFTVETLRLLSIPIPLHDTLYKQ